MVDVQTDVDMEPNIITGCLVPQWVYSHVTMGRRLNGSFRMNQCSCGISFLSS